MTRCTVAAVITLWAELTPVAGLAHHVPEKDVVTLYRSSVVSSGARYHVATFDAESTSFGGTRFDYNWENCTTSAQLRMAQPLVRTLFWCERGYAKPDIEGE